MLCRFSHLSWVLPVDLLGRRVRPEVSEGVVDLDGLISRLVRLVFPLLVSIMMLC